MCAQYLHSEACAIELEDRVILTGLGFVPTQVTSQLAISASYLVATVYLYYLSAVSILQVTAYNAEGYLADLPSLTTGRYSHGCGHFVNTAHREVGRGRSQSIHCLKTVQNTLILCAGVPGDRGRPLPLHGLHGGAGGGGGGLEGGRAPAQPQVRAAGGQPR